MKFTLIAVIVTFFHFGCASYLPCVTEGENCITEPYNCCYGMSCQETTGGWLCVYPKNVFLALNSKDSKVEELNVIPDNACIGRGSNCAVVPHGCCEDSTCVKNTLGSWVCE